MTEYQLFPIVGGCRRKVVTLYPSRDIHQTDHNWNLDEWTNDGGKSRTAVDSEGCDSDRDREFEIVGKRR